MFLPFITALNCAPPPTQQSFYFKLRSMIPCCLCHLNFTVAVPEEELIQVGRPRPFWNNKCTIFHEYLFSLIIFALFFSITSSTRLQWQQWPWRLTKTRLRRSHLKNLHPKVYRLISLSSLQSGLGPWKEDYLCIYLFSNFTLEICLKKTKFCE